MPNVIVIGMKCIGPDAWVLLAPVTIQGWSIRDAQNAVAAANGPGSYRIYSLTREE